MPINVIPLSDRVIIDPIIEKETTSVGLYIPDAAREKPTRGIVLAVGVGTDRVNMVAKEGDIVLFGENAGTRITIDGKQLVMIKHDEMFAILE